MFFLQNLLRHPLCLALVRRKWKKYGRYLYYIGLLSYLVFLFFLTSYALLTPNAQNVRTLSEEKGAPFCQDSSNDKDIEEKSYFLYVCQIGIIVISIFNCLMELIQFYRVRTFNFFNLTY